MHMKRTVKTLLSLAVMLGVTLPAAAQVAVKGKIIYTMAGEPITDGVVVIRDGKIAEVGSSRSVRIPAGFKVLQANVVTPGLVDAHTVVGLAGQFNSDADQDQLESSSPLQPELRALDAYNSREVLIQWIRSYGVTTIHTGHGPGELISGQTIIAKTTGNTAEDAAFVKFATVAATLSESAMKSQGKSPGTRGKMMAMLRAELIKAREHMEKVADAEEGKAPARNLGYETLGKVLSGDVPLMVTAHLAQDIASVLRLAEEFGIRVILDGGSESYLLIDEIKAAGIPVFVHPTMTRSYGETKNLNMETAGKLHAAGIPIALQSGFESYVPKTRVVLYEAGVAIAHGLPFEAGLGSITIDAARILGIDDRVGSIEVGKDGDLALYDGDPFEFTTHCIGAIIEGEVVSDLVR